MSCYTLFNECRLPWPSSNCLYVLTPFASRLNTLCVAAWQLTVYPALPDLLTKPRPTNVQHRTYNLSWEGCSTRTFKVWESDETICSGTANHYLYLTILLYGHCYSKEYFGWNQLLNCSMSLSLLYPTSTSDLHVNTVQELLRKFLSASFKSGIDRNLSGFSHLT